MDHIVFIVFVLFAIISSIVKKAAKSRGDSMSSPDPADEMERARRFREALGLPRDSVPPGPVRKRVRLEPPPMLPVEPPNAGSPLPGRLRRVPPAPPAPLEAPPMPRNIPPPVGKVRDIVAPHPVPAFANPLVLTEQAPMMPLPSAKLPEPALPQLPSAYRKDQGVESAAAGRSKRAADLLALLRMHGSARNAMVLREVLGPPKALA